MKFTAREDQLRQMLTQKKLSSSHHLDHLEKVAEFAAQLAEIHQGQREIVVAAALLHDLGRSHTELRGTETATQAALEAPELLQQAGFSQEENTQITQCIAEHDDPKFHSRLLESRILKDADYLDGFGARGILRSLMYAGETGADVAEAVDRLRRKMRDRLDGLEFVESRRLAWQQWRLVEIFLSELEKPPTLSAMAYPGKLIVLEGISGSGKDTQAELLVQALEKAGREVLSINHPTLLLKELWKIWKPQVKNEVSDVFLLLADRFRMVREQIQPALAAGKIVISSRSSISAQAYQPSADFDVAWYRLWYMFEPLYDLVLYFDLDPQLAAGRTQQRVEQGKESTTGFFDKTQASQHQRYQEVLTTYPNVVVIDASQGIEDVHAQVLKAVDSASI